MIRPHTGPGQFPGARVPASGGGGSIVGGVLTSVIVSVLVLVAGVHLVGRQPPWALQPATSASAKRTGRRPLPVEIAATAQLEDDDDPSILMDSLRVLGLVRRRVERPVVGRKAYVRLWERARALFVLTVIIVTLGALLAGTIGVIFLAAGFLLEQAIG